ncbi:Protoheme IX farnesyltransferase, mitochondrial [Candidozyma auris]|uniref:Protoheme IX farnesyltransferase, mitochondrial n=3 Tax=Candidozyma auris TaxID=498019 RepID=A0A2H0ZGB2_CANAR|nr:hypothetical protein QG37_03744 [[Candida] auris]PIS49681.1 protoheme IX farnesyltransferase [[Candida] auris]PIS50056.1 protoheme IX farnesyltransferase [[Candida] auris]QWW25192.1 hypothetical protein CA7LBN_004074 [[Candida] auris]GBL51978.1 putative protoheme IX farnesyltransferase [[Candida] auris]
MIARATTLNSIGKPSRLEFFLSNSRISLKFDKLYSNQNLGRVLQGRLNSRAAFLPSKQCTDSFDPSYKKQVSRSANVKDDRDNRDLPFTVTPRERSRKCNPPETSMKRSALSHYLKLTKPNLTVLVTLSSICSYAMSPNTVSVSELVLLTVGVALCSGSANAINMGREPDFDRKMIRTSSRPIVKGVLTSNQAFKFAAITGIAGSFILYHGVNPTVAALGMSNIILYGWCYTSLKRKSILNTWVGAIVGAIPPLMGWAASSSLSHPGAWCLAALLYAWQFPHFNALSHNIATQYKEAGYVMAAAENPRLNSRVSLRYSLLMFPICFGLSYFGVTDWVFCIDSSIANAWLSVLAYRFWKQQKINHSTTSQIPGQAIEAANLAARKLFWCSVWQLPAVLVLAMLHKKGQWDRLLSWIGIL